MEHLLIFTHLDAWASLLTLTVLEIVLGVDNIVFVALATQGLPPDRALVASRIGLSLAVFMRLALLSGMFWLTKLTAPLFSVWGHDFSGRDLILALGGFFLLYKGTAEIHEEIDASTHEEGAKPGKKSFFRAILTIAMLDIVFSLDTVLTAIGMADDLLIMCLAVIIAILIMILAAGPVGTFIRNHPTVKMLALAFLLLIGMTLVADAFHYHIPKGFIYSAIGFSLAVEGLNQWARRNRRKAHGVDES